MTTILLIFLGWLACSTAAAGLLFADEKAMHGTHFGPRLRKEGLGLSLILGGMCGLLGPLGVVLALLLTGFGHNGWSLSYRS